MNILLLSCNTGQGHNSAAHAIKEAFEKKGHTCELQNALLFLSLVDDKVISNGHTFVYKRLPKLFGIGYRYEERHEPKFICRQMRRGIGKFKRFLDDNHFDVIISTHVFGAILVNELKKRTGQNYVSAFVLTDYTCCPGAYECKANIYFTPHPALTEEFVSAGIEKDRVVPSGIPVSKHFTQIKNKTEIRAELSLPTDKRIILVGFGSMGCGPLVKIVQKLSHKLSNDLIIVACGNNKAVLDKLLKSNCKNIMPLPYTKRMADYLASCDLFISKAGGLSTTEAVYSTVPLLYINAVPGCETKNIEFMTRNGYANCATSPDDAISKALYMLDNLNDSQQMISKCREDLPSDPAEAIASYVESYMQEKK